MNKQTEENANIVKGKNEPQSDTQNCQAIGKGNPFHLAESIT